MAKTQKPAPKGGKKTAAPKKVAKPTPKKGRASNVSTKINRTNQPMPPLADAKQQARVIAELAASLMSAVDLGASVSTPKKKSIWHSFRSAITGRWVKPLFAKLNPSTTVREKVRK